MINVLSIALGGALGSVFRYSIQKMFNLSFPVGTLLVNIAGCFIAGWLLAVFIKAGNTPMHLFLLTGFCGGFTTFSAFSLESIQMIMAGRWAVFSLYIILSVVGGLLATFSGYKLFG